MLTDRIQTIHEQPVCGTYGAPRVHAELRAEGTCVGRKRVARLMREAGLRGVSRRKGTATTTGSSNATPANDLVRRDFEASGPDELWVADITYVPTASGFLYLSVVVDAFSRAVVGWKMASNLRTELVLSSMEMALGQRRPEEVVHHSDRGNQYTSIAFGKRCERAGVRPSTGSSCYDNALCESFFATLECELIERERFASHAAARMRRRAWRSSPSSKAGTTRNDATPPWVTSGRWFTKSYIKSDLQPQAADRPRKRGNSNSMVLPYRTELLSMRCYVRLAHQTATSKLYPTNSSGRGRKPIQSKD